MFPKDYVIFAAHPDDEIIGAAATMARNRPRLVIHVTDGAPRDMHDAHAAGFATREAYAQARRNEAIAALQLAGVSEKDLHFFGIIDQEASLNMARLSRMVSDLLKTLRPQQVLTHPYEGGHPDHDATSFAVHTASLLLSKQGIGPPEILEFTSYHMGPTGMEISSFLPPLNQEITCFLLGEDERRLKHSMFDCHKTQREVLKSFSFESECFRIAPHYDFLQPPHPGKLFYENFNWGMTGARWRENAAAALNELGLGAPANATHHS